MTDTEFRQTLREFLKGAATPYYTKSDGSIDREKTLALPCYEGFKVSQVAEKK